MLIRGTAFLLGFGITFFPTVIAPLAALFFFLSRQWQPTRLDALWAVAIFLSTISWGWNGGLSGAAFGALQIGGAWLVYRAFVNLRKYPVWATNSKLIGSGLLTGLATIVFLGWMQIDQVNFAMKTLAQAIVWERTPTLYGHTILVLGGLIAILSPTPRLRILSLMLSALGILTSGSREAALAWVLVAVILVFLGPKRSIFNRFLEIALITGMLTVTAGLGPLLGWGRVGFLLNVEPQLNRTNLFQGTEVPNGDWWDHSQVSVTSTKVSIGKDVLTGYRVTKLGAEPWRRLQQIVPINSNEVYTMSAWLRPEDGTWPSLQGWGQFQNDDTTGTFGLSVRLISGEAQVSVNSYGRVLNAQVIEHHKDWSRLAVTFEFLGPAEKLYWYVGLAPDSRLEEGTSTTFAGFQLERGQSATTYVPGTTTEGLSFQLSRIPYWKAALRGIAERPLFGWGERTFPGFFQNLRPERNLLHAVPSHTHNLALQIMFERGLVGLLGLLTFLLIVCWRAIRQRDLPFLAVLGAVLFANMYDYTLFYGGVLYPLVAVAGWRGAQVAHLETRTDTSSKQFAVRLTLAFVDLIMVTTSILAAWGIQKWLGGSLEIVSTVLAEPATLLYLLLIWPLIAWREGLYPGYGLTAPQELKKQVSAAALSGVIFSVVVLFLLRATTIPGSVLVLMFLLSIIFLPLGRGLAKRMLLKIHLWGQPVIIIGANEAGQRVGRALSESPLNGLHPVCFFDDDPGKYGTMISGLPVRGAISEIEKFAIRYGIRQAVITTNCTSADTLSRIAKLRSKVFEKVQFVPYLPHLPVSGIRAGSLNDLLTLEVSSELSIPVNQFGKRLLDLIGATVGIVLISPFAWIMAVAVYLESPGPIFYRSHRIGKNGVGISVWKFRTMIPDAEERLTTLLSEHKDLREEWRVNQKLHKDPRITRVGRLLRKTSFDELPQLWNVLIGEMSLVGPRPIVSAETHKYAAAFEIYKIVRPGMTGYWQVSGRSGTSYTQRIELDTFYVRNWSIWLDIHILLKTIMVVLRRDGAY
jgi:Undecaprenyl-phosphate galactose phosphotransferase WbaP